MFLSSLLKKVLGQKIIKGMKLKKLLVILFIFVLAGNVIFAETTVTLRLTGTVAAVTSLTISASTADFGIFTEEAVVDSLVATVTEMSNSTKGFTVRLTTKNGTTSGLLSGPGGDTIPYTIKYNDIVVPFATGTFEVTNRSFFSTVSELKTVKISYDIDDVTELNFGIYTDTLTFVIASQ